MLIDAGLQNVQLSVDQPTFMEGEGKLIHPISLEAHSDAIIAEQMATATEIKSVVAELYALAHNHLKGGGFDLPIVEPIFEEYISTYSLDERLGFYPGDFFNDPLPGADVLVMDHTLHDWDLEEKMMLLGKAYEALPKGGALIVYESMIDDERRTNSYALQMSLTMLIETPGGFDDTGGDCRGWMGHAGFQETYVQHLVGPETMVVGIK